MARTMISLAHNDMKMPLPRALRVSDPLSQNSFRLFNILAMQIDRVTGDVGIVGTEDVIWGLFVVSVCLVLVTFGFFAELVGSGAITGFVGFVRLARQFLFLGYLLVG
jgi:hypothetical protein